MAGQEAGQAHVATLRAPPRQRLVGEVSNSKNLSSECCPSPCCLARSRDGSFLDPGAARANGSHAPLSLACQTLAKHACTKECSPATPPSTREAPQDVQDSALLHNPNRNNRHCRRANQRTSCPFNGSRSGGTHQATDPSGGNSNSKMRPRNQSQAIPGVPPRPRAFPRKRTHSRRCRRSTMGTAHSPLPSHTEGTTQAPQHSGGRCSLVRAPLQPQHPPTLLAPLQAMVALASETCSPAGLSAARQCPGGQPLCPQRPHAARKKARKKQQLHHRTTHGATALPTPPTRASSLVFCG